MPRLPQPGGDTNNWGAILNEYLQASHKSDGSLKDGVVNGAVVQNGSLTGAKLQNGTITESKLDSALVTKVNTSAGTTNLGTNTTATTVEVTSSSGTNATLSGVTTTSAGVLSSADKTKLNGIATAATANQSDASLLSRANHTGTQAVASVTGLQAALDGKASSSHAHALTDLSDVSTSGASANQVLKYNGTSWAPSSDDVSGGTGGANLTSTVAAASVTINSDSGTDATISAATTTDAGVLSAADKTKLNGVTTGATANQTDANLLNRSNHTGAQAVATITGLQTALDGKAALAHNHAASNITSGVIDTARLGTGTASNANYLRGDGTWVTPSTGSSDPTVGGDLSGTASNAQIVAGAVGTSELADNGVTTLKLNNLAVTDTKIATNAITAAKIASDAVTTTKIINDAVTEPKLAVTNAPGSNQVLSWNGSAMAWVTPATGGGSSAWNIRQITTATVSAANNDWIIAKPIGNSITVNLPAPTASARVRVKRALSSGNSILIAPANGGQLDGGEPTQATLNAGWSSQDYESDGTDWFVV